MQRVIREGKKKCLPARMFGKVYVFLCEVQLIVLKTLLKIKLGHMPFGSPMIVDVASSCCI